MNSFLEEALKLGLVLEIDSKSGFCFGVSRAVKIAETHLQEGAKLVSMGDIVHNDQEIQRLRQSGMETVVHGSDADLKGKTVLFRAHGEPPASYAEMKAMNVEVVDATCPVVLKLQERVRQAWLTAKKEGGQIAIYGKRGHAEVIGLVGQTEGEAMVLESPDDVTLLDPDKKTILFSQTTKSYEGLQALENSIRLFLNHAEDLKVHRTICAQVGNRVPHLSLFASKFDLVLFVGGAKSSNGKVLFEVCRNVNNRTYYVSSMNDVQPGWLDTKTLSVGICGATSTPQWLMEQVAERFSEVWISCRERN
ncbi:4-hydroxy-3-methylbut-2-enyl diphosphate reductase [Geofilum sp. OHC36d9]|uniref:4-hydroxy-3-methylbut-2-enyl diphosphate reductase n=1 Tax=Geofilum sp. OHC36d9 TaxID=3458413 RepID=UPI004034B6C2